MKKVLITGAGSYIGESVREYLGQYPEAYSVDMIDTMGFVPAKEEFAGYDVVFNCAGIAHIKETDENRHLYYEVNRDLAVNIAKCAKEAGVRQLILLSSMAVYGKTVGLVKKSDVPSPVNAYGDSKYQADQEIEKMADDHFIFCCLRPPMVYGKNCKGNYQLLRKFSLKSPVFPMYENKRSMVYIGNLCEFVKGCIDDEKSGVFFPQNAEYVNTSEMVRLIAKENHKRIGLTRIFSWAIKIAPVSVVKKVFGDLTYEKVDTVDKYSFEESIRFSEGE